MQAISRDDRSADWRYQPMLAPDEQWSVFDNRTGRPAETQGGYLVGLNEKESRAFALILNAIEVSNDNTVRLAIQHGRLTPLTGD